MKFSPAFSALMCCAVAASAQQPPVPPIPPARATAPVRPERPAPPPRPSRTVRPGDAYYDRYYDHAMDTIDLKALLKLDELRNLSLDFRNNFKFDPELMSADLQNRLRDATQRTAEMGQRVAEAAERGAAIGQRAAEATQRAMETARSSGQFAQAFAPLARIGAEIAANVGETVGRSFSTAQGFATPGWRQDWSQDRDPADSLFGSAREAFNRGDWRHSADLFASVITKFPKSTRVPSAGYYEAFSRYRIGTTDDLKIALRVLGERTSGASSSSYNNGEAASLATRIRGVLAQRGDPEAARQLQADAQKGKSCDSEDMQVRSEALSALAMSDMAAATPMLRRVLEKKDPCALELRRRALGILLRRADTAATSAAIVVAKNADETLDLRTDAIQYLSRLPGDKALAALEDLMRTNNDRDVQRAAVRSLANTENPKARQAIRALIERNDVSEQLRYEALSSFEHDRGGSADDAAYLRSLYPKLQVERLKTQAIAAISKTPGSENEQFVLGVARNTGESSEVRSNAISRMYRLPAITISDIGKIYDAADSRQMRDQVISVLSQRKEPEAIDKLGDIVKNGTDPSTRQRAISALGRKDDPRAKKLLQELVDR